MAESVGTEVETIWAPSREQIESTRLWGFRERLRERRGLVIDDYPAMWEWSVAEPSAFWDEVRQYFGIVGDGFAQPALAEERMPGALWYPGARVNYAENVLRHALDRPDEIAVVAVGEDGSSYEWTWAQLASKVAALAARLRELGVTQGDRVGAVLPNVPEAIVGVLAATSLGAIWTVSSPDLAVTATLDRLRPLQPAVVIGTDGYVFKGVWRDTLAPLRQIVAELPGLKAALVLMADSDADVGDGLESVDLEAAPATHPEFVRVPFDHPLWVLFSSGTTGTPKGLVHGHGGILLEAAKGIGLNFDMGPGDRYFTAANTSWMVWNTLPNTLSVGGTVITYAGAPTWPRADRQFEVVARSRATMLSTGAAYLALVEQSGLRPGEDYDLSSLRLIMSTGSVLAPSTWRWVHDAVKRDVHLSSDSGGTDVCSGLLGCNPWQEEIVGELQAATLGMPIDVRDERGRSLPAGEIGELVLTRPTPSMPVAFWNDPDGALYRAAYFSADPAVWTHGDWISRTPRGGYVVHGRSDATLNRDGVRMGSADIYAALQLVTEVRNGVVLGIELPGGRYWMPLFVELADGAVLDEALEDSIRRLIRSRASARHVPDTIEAVPAIPVTHSGKRIEIPLKKLFLGYPEDAAVNRGALANPDAVDWFVARAAESARAVEGSERG